MKAYSQKVEAYLSLLRGEVVFVAANDGKDKTWHPYEASEYAKAHGLNEAMIQARMVEAANNVTPSRTPLIETPQEDKANHQYIGWAILIAALLLLIYAGRQV